MRTATFVLSTGRCGTQWLASALAAGGHRTLHVEHEPLHESYRPRLMLAAGGGLPADEAAAARVAAHADRIARVLESSDYVECGHPCWSAIPYLASRLAGRVRVVHLTRHPVATAFSWLTHQAYMPPLAPHLAERVLLLPTDAGVSFPEYQDRWPLLSPYEKCLYYWAEVHAFGLRHEEGLGVPWLRVTYETLFEPGTLAAVWAFLGMAPGEASLAPAAVVDRFRYVLPAWFDPALAGRHACVTEVAQRLGYRPADVDAGALRERYSRAGGPGA